MEINLPQFAEWSRHLIRSLERHQEDEMTTTKWDLSQWELQDDNQTCPYLVHPPVFTVSHETKEDSNGDEGGNGFLLEDENVITDEHEVSIPQDLGVVETSTQVQWNFSIVFSETYGVPVLYFRVQTLDGCPCERSEVLKWLPNQAIADSWDFVSQEEHPISGLPAYFLHPCQTSSRLKETLRPSQHGATILWAWMSMVFPAVNHPISPSFYKYILHQLNGLQKNPIGDKS